MIFCGSALEDFAPASSAPRHGLLERCSSPSPSPQAGTIISSDDSSCSLWGRGGGVGEKGLHSLRWFTAPKLQMIYVLARWCCTKEFL